MSGHGEVFRVAKPAGVDAVRSLYSDAVPYRANNVHPASNVLARLG